MKKFGFVLLAACFLLVGCGKEETTNETVKEDTTKEETLVCSTYTESDLNFTTYMTITFENNKASELIVKYVYDLSEFTEDQIKTMDNLNMCSVDDIKNKLGMNDCKESLSGTEYTVEGHAEELLKQVVGGAKLVKEAYDGAGWSCNLID